MTRRSTGLDNISALLRDRRAGQAQAALQVLTVSRDQFNADRLRCINALTALIRSRNLGIDARKALTTRQFATIAAWRRRDEDLGTAIARAEAVRLAKSVIELDRELADNHEQIDQIVTTASLTYDIEVRNAERVTAPPARAIRHSKEAGGLVRSDRRVRGQPFALGCSEAVLRPPLTPEALTEVCSSITFAAMWPGHMANTPMMRPPRLKFIAPARGGRPSCAQEDLECSEPTSSSPALGTTL